MLWGVTGVVMRLMNRYVAYDVDNPERMVVSLAMEGNYSSLILD